MRGEVHPVRHLTTPPPRDAPTCTPSNLCPYLVASDRYDPERLSICAAAANDDLPALDGLLAQGVHVDSRHRIRTYRGWHHERYTPLISACSQVAISLVVFCALHGVSMRAIA